MIARLWRRFRLWLATGPAPVAGADQYRRAFDASVGFLPGRRR